MGGAWARVGWRLSEREARATSHSVARRSTATNCIPAAAAASGVRDSAGGRNQRLGRLRRSRAWKTKLRYRGRKFSASCAHENRVHRRGKDGARAGGRPRPGRHRPTRRSSPARRAARNRAARFSMSSRARTGMAMLSRLCATAISSSSRSSPSTSPPSCRACARRRAGKLFLSLAAGITLAQMDGWLPGARFVRAMPNTPMQIGLGASVYAAGAGATRGLISR